MVLSLCFRAVGSAVTSRCQHHGGTTRQAQLAQLTDIIYVWVQQATYTQTMGDKCDITEERGSGAISLMIRDWCDITHDITDKGDRFSPIISLQHFTIKT